MKKIFLLAAFITCSMLAKATHTAEVSGVEFGANYAEASKQFVTLFGMPVATTPSQIIYKEKEHLGVKFDDVVFKFQHDDTGTTFLNEARLTIVSSTRAQARLWVEKIAEKLIEKYPGTSWDLEDDGSKFYKGGTSPVNQTYLFTIYMYRSGGKYLSVLRYGPLPYVK